MYETNKLSYIKIFKNEIRGMERDCVQECVNNPYFFVRKAKKSKLTKPALGGAGPNWEQFRSAHIPSQLAPRSVELGAGPNWEQLVQLAQGRA